LEAQLDDANRRIDVLPMEIETLRRERQGDRLHAGQNMKSSRRNISARTAQALQRPLARLGVVLGAIFLVELSLMLATDRLQLDMTGWAGALIDAATLTAVASTIIWPLIVRPLRVALETEHAKAQVILDAASDAIITIDDHGIIQSQNRAAQIMFGVSDQDAIGHNVSVIIPSPHRERHNRYMENYRRTGVKHMIGATTQIDAIRMDGEVFPIELSISEIRARGKHFFTAIIRDVTERRRLAACRTQSPWWMI